MFTKTQEEPRTSPNKAETVIGSSVKLTGDFHGEGDIIIEGTLDGSLKTTNHLFIGDKAKVNANVEANEARIGGEIKGNIKIKGHLEITSTARITGDVEVSSLSMARGAILNGKCTMSNPDFTHKPQTTEQKK